MPELGPADVDKYTKGRLPASDSETQNILNRALAAARRYCEWHVTPQHTGDTVVLDGPGSRVLMLPTLKLQKLNSVVEDGIPLDLTTLAISAGGPIRLRKNVSGVPSDALSWRTLRWTHTYSGIVVNMDHGYLEADAEDWRMAVLDAVDRFSLEVGRGNLQRLHVDDVLLMWFDKHDVFNNRLMEPYRLKAPG